MSRPLWCQPCALASPRREVRAAGLVDGDEPVCAACGASAGDRYRPFPAPAPPVPSGPLAAHREPRPVTLPSGEAILLAPGAVMGAEPIAPHQRRPVPPRKEPSPAPKSRGRSIPESVRQQVLAAPAHEPHAHVAARLGVSDVWVARVRREAGIPMPGRGGESSLDPAVRDAVLAEPREAGPAAIARKYGLTVGLVRGLRRRHPGKTSLHPSAAPAAGLPDPFERLKTWVERVEEHAERYVSAPEPCAECAAPAPAGPELPPSPVPPADLRATAAADLENGLSIRRPPPEDFPPLRVTIPSTPTVLLTLTLQVTDAQCDRVFQNQPLARKAALLASLPPEAWL